MFVHIGKLACNAFAAPVRNLRAMIQTMVNPMNDKPTIENLESWFDANAGKRRSYAQKMALRFCGLLISAMRENEMLQSVVETCECGAAEALSNKDSDNG